MHIYICIYIYIYIYIFKGLRHSADPFCLSRLHGALMRGSSSLLGVDFGSLGSVLGPLGASWGLLRAFG